MSTEKHTEYAIARGNEVITAWSQDLSFVLGQHGVVEDGMRVAQLEPDTHVVESEVEVTTKRGRAHAYEPPQIELSQETSSAGGPDSDPEPGRPKVQLPKSGIWGDEDGSIGASIAAQQAASGEAPQGGPSGEAPVEATPAPALQEAAASTSSTAADAAQSKVVSTDGSSTAPAGKGKGKGSGTVTP